MVPEWSLNATCHGYLMLLRLSNASVFEMTPIFTCDLDRKRRIICGWTVEKADDLSRIWSSKVEILEIFVFSQ